MRVAVTLTRAAGLLAPASLARFALAGLLALLGGSMEASGQSAASRGAPPPSGWILTFEDDFTQPPAQGPDALDAGRWSQRSFGTGVMHGGVARWNNGQNLQSTGTTIRVHVRRGNDLWLVDGFNQGIQNTDPRGFGFHPGYHEFHVQFRARFSTLAAKGVGAYALMWPASGKWSSEIDIVEMPGARKDRSMTTVHWDPSGRFNLGETHHYTPHIVPLDLTQWRVYDLRRTYRMVNGKRKAAVTLWIDGVRQPQPDGWVDNEFLCEPMIFGVATYVQQPDNSDWYGGPPDASTPRSSYFELDYVAIWTPEGPGRDSRRSR